MRKLLVLILSFSSCVIFSQNLDFFREDLCFTISGGYFIVDGDYYFRNKLDIPLKMKLKYPFPDITKYGAVISVFCIDNKSGDSCSVFLSNQQFMMFDIDLEAREEKNYQIGYRQKMHGNTAMYILTTTQQWGKPFDTVNYRLLVRYYLVDSLSYIPDTVEMINDVTFFYWRKKDFMPDRDFYVQFSNKPE